MRYLAMRFSLGIQAAYFRPMRGRDVEPMLAMLATITIKLRADSARLDCSSAASNAIRDIRSKGLR